MTPCEHTLFIATDAGFEHRSERFDRLMGITGVDADDLDTGDRSWDAYTDELRCADAVKFASYLPAPSGFGVYVGFAPLELH